jgi:hypothetical protein
VFQTRHNSLTHVLKGNLVHLARYVSYRIHRYTTIRVSSVKCLTSSLTIKVNAIQIRFRISEHFTNFQAPTRRQQPPTTLLTDLTAIYATHEVLNEGVADMELELACSVGAYKEFRPTQNTRVSVLTHRVLSGTNVVNTEKESC